MNKILIILVFIIYSCKGQDKDNKKCLEIQKKYEWFYDKINDAKEKKEIKNFQINYDSAKIYLDRLIQCFPENNELLREKLGLLEMNNNTEEMIPVYDKLIATDTIKNRKYGYNPNGEPVYDYRFGRFYCMLISDSIKYKKSMQEYYEYVEKNEISIPELLKNIDTNGNEIYKRMGLSYYFNGKQETLENFKSISSKIPYKFSYDNIKLNQMTPIDFFKDYVNSSKEGK